MLDSVHEGGEDQWSEKWIMSQTKKKKEKDHFFCMELVKASSSEINL